jgi:purine catabolism regulator
LEKNTFFYENIGILEILFAVKDEEILRKFAEKRLGKLEEYDRKHPLDLINTLFYYLKTDCSLADAGEILFLHRNTIGYRVNKIKEISGAGFDTAEERYEYLTAVYIRKMGIV